ncbi:hypothetical protein QBC42DRAFT_3352 [Cladorrhinum samala]|uniref:Secreted protein n=1 Tax=Cladorrhinum samala TaxID=585594 RepID=A0AAV9HZE0_9PEZI|nr:hypothetical protein QBC42DRAFT_3352 [Cladorrhinum samala]
MCTFFIYLFVFLFCFSSSSSLLSLFCPLISSLLNPLARSRPSSFFPVTHARMFSALLAYIHNSAVDPSRSQYFFCYPELVYDPVHIPLTQPPIRHLSCCNSDASRRDQRSVDASARMLLLGIAGSWGHQF